MFSQRERSVFLRLWQSGRESRLELARLLKMTPNAAGDVVSSLLSRRVLRECDPAGKGRGRPSIPVEIDTGRQHMIGLALQPGSVEVARLNLRGQLLDSPVRTAIVDPSKLVRMAARAIEKACEKDVFAIGITATGFVDLEHRRLLVSSALGALPEADLAPLYETCRGKPLFLQNDMHALAARWLLTCNAPVHEDCLLVLLADGQVGAAVLVDGRPNAGCVAGGNELGHMRFPIPTEMCYCGHRGCFERIFSSQHARARLGTIGSLGDGIRVYDGHRSPLSELIDLTANALANAANLLRVHRIVIASPYTKHALFTNDLLRRTRECLMPGLSDRVRIDLWEQAAASRAETAGFLPLANMCLDAWA